MIINKEKQKENRIQDEEVLLYKHYSILSKLSNLKNPEPTFVQDKVNNIEKYMNFLQAPVKTILSELRAMDSIYFHFPSYFLFYFYFIFYFET